MEVQFSRLAENDLHDLAQKDCDILVIASYDWRVPDWRPYLKYAVNFHPSLLPDDRGPYPLIQGILQQREVWGVTCHKVANEFDSGDILDAKPFPMAADECHESLDLKIQMAAKQLAQHIAADFTNLWNNAKPQGEGSYTRLWTTQDRTIDFSEKVADILRRARAFGLIECLAKISDTDIFVKRAIGWTEPHHYPPGKPVHVNGMSIVIAAKDGYIGIIEWSLVDPTVVPGKVLS
jgi:methionyl-tRNA formyltransferase